MPQNKQRPGFMVYFGDWEAPRQLLNPEQFKVFFDAAFNYAQDGEIPGPFEDHMIKVFFDTKKGTVAAIMPNIIGSIESNPKANVPSSCWLSLPILPEMFCRITIRDYCFHVKSQQRTKRPKIMQNG